MIAHLWQCNWFVIAQRYSLPTHIVWISIAPNTAMRTCKYVWIFKFSNRRFSMNRRLFMPSCQSNCNEWIALECLLWLLSDWSRSERLYRELRFDVTRRKRPERLRSRWRISVFLSALILINVGRKLGAKRAKENRRNGEQISRTYHKCIIEDHRDQSSRMLNSKRNYLSSSSITNQPTCLRTALPVNLFSLIPN